MIFINTILLFIFTSLSNMKNFVSFHSIFTRVRNNLAVPYQGLPLTEQSDPHLGASVWNILPLFIRSLASFLSFRARVKNYFLER